MARTVRRDKDSGTLIGGQICMLCSCLLLLRSRCMRDVEGLSAAHSHGAHHEP